MENNKVSIITPAYNAEKLIPETIRSVLAQTYCDWEMIIVDDGSKDRTADVVREFSNQDSRIRLIQQPNGGSSNARNHGLRNATGRYIALLDSDDLWDSNFLEEMICFMKEKNALVAQSSLRFIDENSKPIFKPYICRPLVTYNDMLVTDHVACLSALYDTSKTNIVFLHEEMKSILDDYAYWLDVIRIAGPAYGNPKVLTSYRVMKTSVTGKKWKMVKYHFLFYRNYLKLSLIRCVFNTFYWGIRGFFKFR